MAGFQKSILCVSPTLKPISNVAVAHQYRKTGFPESLGGERWAQNPQKIYFFKKKNLSKGTPSNDVKETHLPTVTFPISPAEHAVNTNQAPGPLKVDYGPWSNCITTKVLLTKHPSDVVKTRGVHLVLTEEQTGQKKIPPGQLSWKM